MSVSVADCTLQPSGTAGSPNRTSARMFALDFPCTLSVESAPLLLDGPPWSIQLSAFADTVTGVPQSGAVTVQACVAAVSSSLPAASIARTAKVCGPSPRLV